MVRGRSGAAQLSSGERPFIGPSPSFCCHTPRLIAGETISKRDVREKRRRGGSGRMSHAPRIRFARNLGHH